jgi:hypothetical protein
MICNNCGKEINNDCIEELKMNAYNTIEWYKAEAKLWKNKYDLLLESKIKEIKILDK